MNKFLITGLCLFLPIIGHSQQLLTLNDAILVAKSESPTLQKAELNLKQSFFSLKAARLQFWSTVNLNATTPLISKDLTQVVDQNTGQVRFVEQNYLSYSSQLSINQPITFTDGTLSLIAGLSQYKQTNFGQETENFVGDLRLRLSQPIFTYNRRQIGLEQAEIQLDLAEKNYLTSLQNIIYQVKSAYFDWYRSKELLKIAEEELEQVQASYELSKKKYDAGIIAEVEVLKLEVDYASSQNDVLQKQATSKQDESRLKMLIGMPLDAEINQPDILNLNKVPIPTDQVLPMALKNRPEMGNAAKQVRLQEINVMQTDAFREFRADLTLEVGLTKQDPQLAYVFQDPNQAQTVSLNLTIPILDWGRNAAQVMSQQAQLESSQIDEIQSEKELTQEINQLIENYIQADNRLRILEKSVELAQKSYDITYAKFRNGNVSSEELAQSQTRLTDAKVNSLSALMDYNLSIAALTRACLYDWETQTSLAGNLPTFEN